TERVQPDGQGMGQRAVAEAFDRAAAAQEPPAAELVGSDGAPRGKGSQLLEVDDRVLAARDGAKAALGQPPLERHLTALVAGRGVAPRARQPSLVAAAGGLAVPRSRTPADALARAARSRRGVEVTQIDPLFHTGCPQSSVSTRCATARIMPRTAAESLRMTDWPMRLRPRPRSVSRCRGLVPMALRRSRIFTMRSLTIGAPPRSCRAARPRRRVPSAGQGPPSWRAPCC